MVILKQAWKTLADDFKGMYWWMRAAWVVFFVILFPLLYWAVFLAERYRLRDAKVKAEIESRHKHIVEKIKEE